MTKFKHFLTAHESTRKNKKIPKEANSWRIKVLSLVPPTRPPLATSCQDLGVSIPFGILLVRALSPSSRTMHAYRILARAWQANWPNTYPEFGPSTNRRELPNIGNIRLLPSPLPCQDGILATRVWESPFLLCTVSNAINLFTYLPFGTLDHLVKSLPL